MKKQQQAQKEKFRPRRSNAGVGFFTIAREERLVRQKNKKAEISAKR